MSDKILITEDALAETIRCTICKNPNKTERGCDGSCQYDKELLTKIVEAVTGIAEKRPHGEWIFKHNSSDIWCSNCDENFDEIPQKFLFCPNCGADMRKEGGDS